jgi:hypothetical protein
LCAQIRDKENIISLHVKIALVQVRMTGRICSFGDIDLVCARVARRTSDAQHVGSVVAFRHSATSLPSHAHPALAEVQEMFFEELGEQSSDSLPKAAFKLMTVPGGQDQVFDDKDEAMQYVVAAVTLQ